MTDKEKEIRAIRTINRKADYDTYCLLADRDNREKMTFAQWCEWCLSGHQKDVHSVFYGMTLQEYVIL